MYFHHKRWRKQHFIKLQIRLPKLAFDVVFRSWWDIDITLFKDWLSSHLRLKTRSKLPVLSFLHYNWLIRTWARCSLIDLIYYTWCFKHVWKLWLKLILLIKLKSLLIRSRTNVFYFMKESFLLEACWLVKTFRFVDEWMDFWFFYNAFFKTSLPIVASRTWCVARSSLEKPWITWAESHLWFFEIPVEYSLILLRWDRRCRFSAVVEFCELSLHWEI